MKKNLISTFFAILFVVILAALFSLIFSLIHYKAEISINKYIVLATSAIIFFFAGMIFGFLNKKQGLLGSLTFILVYLIYFIITNYLVNKGDYDKVLIIFMVGRCIAYMCGAILSVNLRKN